METVQIQTALLKAGILTVDEVRAQRGLRPMEPTRQLEKAASEPKSVGSEL